MSSVFPGSASSVVYKLPLSGAFHNLNLRSNASHILKPLPRNRIQRTQCGWSTCQGFLGLSHGGDGTCSPYVLVGKWGGGSIWKGGCTFGTNRYKCGKDYAVGTSTCASCAANRYGPSCTVCSCGVGGTCSSGIQGSGACTCKTGYGGSGCNTCASQYVKSGSTCIGPCPGGDCGSGGSCAVLSGTLSCTCDAGWKGTAPMCVCVCVCVCVRVLPPPPTPFVTPDSHL